MLRGSDNVIKWFEATGFKYWSIFSKGSAEKGVFLFRSDEDDNATQGGASDDLRVKLGLLHRGTFSITASPKPKRDPRGFSQVDFEIDSNHVMPAGVNGPAPSVVDIQAEIKSALDKYKTEQELQRLKDENAELKKQNKELEKEAHEPMNKIAGVLAPHMPRILGLEETAQPQVAGVPGTSQPEETTLTEQQQETVSNFLSALAAHDTDWENTLKKITGKINGNPGVINTIKTFF